MTLAPEFRSLADLSRITAGFATVPLPGSPHDHVLIVRFAGEYGVGSAGNGDAAFMSAMVAAGLDAWPPAGVVLDLRELSYEWGDMMSQVLGRTLFEKAAPPEMIAQPGPRVSASAMASRPIPTRVVVSDHCREALTSLVRDEMQDEPERWLFDTLENAVAAVADYWKPHLTDRRESPADA
jgi:hypothetical protein